MNYIEAWETIINAKKIAIASHIKPDADTLGSCLALENALRQMGKKVHLYNASILDSKYKFLPGFHRIKNKISINEFDLVIFCDCGNFKRAGLEEGEYKIINIDHHDSNSLFGHINLVDGKKASTSCIVYELLDANKINISSDIAMNIYVGIVEDTNFFTIGDLNEEFFILISKLVKKRINVSQIAKSLMYNKGLYFFRLRQIVYNKFKLLKNAKIITVFITKEDIRRCGASARDISQIANELQSLASVQFLIAVVEDDLSEKLKISLRSNVENISAGKIASFFKGGGHAHAAGFEISKCNEEEIIEKIFNALRKENFI